MEKVNIFSSKKPNFLTSHKLCRLKILEQEINPKKKINSKAENQFLTFPLKKNTDFFVGIINIKLLSLRPILYLEVFELCFFL